MESDQLHHTAVDRITRTRHQIDIDTDPHGMNIRIEGNDDESIVLDLSGGRLTVLHSMPPENIHPMLTLDVTEAKLLIS